MACMTPDMAKVIIDMTMSLDGYVAGPGDGPEFPRGKHDGRAIDSPRDRVIRRPAGEP